MNAKRKGSLNLAERVIAYLPIVGTIVVLVVQSFFQDFLDGLSLRALIAAMATAMVLLVWFLESRIGVLTSAIDTMAGEQRKLIDKTTKNFEFMPLSEAYAAAATHGRKVDHLRVFAVTGVQTVTCFLHSGIVASKASVLIYSPPEEDERLIGQIDTTIDGWRALVAAGKIRALEIRRYKFLPTQYEAIFDDHYLVSGLFQPGNNETVRLTVRNPLVATDRSVPGARLVKEHTERFDLLFESVQQVEGRLSVSSDVGEDTDGERPAHADGSAPAQ